MKTLKTDMSRRVLDGNLIIIDLFCHEQIGRAVAQIG